MSFDLPPFEQGQEQSLGIAVRWLAGITSSSMAATLCVIAVASVGLLALQGRFPIRQGARVIFGCFVLLGAPMIAAAIANLARGEIVTPNAPSAQVGTNGRALPPASYDPYAGASLRRD